MGFELGFEKTITWEMGLGPPLHDPLQSFLLTFLEEGNLGTSIFLTDEELGTIEVFAAKISNLTKWRTKLFDLYLKGLEYRQ